MAYRHGAAICLVQGSEVRWSIDCADDLAELASVIASIYNDWRTSNPDIGLYWRINGDTGRIEILIDKGSECEIITATGPDSSARSGDFQVEASGIIATNMVKWLQPERLCQARPVRLQYFTGRELRDLFAAI
jgi:hypothetical protein